MVAEDRTGFLLFGYWRSSSAYRVRIALNLKGVEYQQKFIHLVRQGGEQHQADYREVNPLGLVPALIHDGRTIVQSMAICEYLEETVTSYPLLPGDAGDRARIRSLAQSIASEIQPLNNLAVMQYLKAEMNLGDEPVNTWYRHWIQRGFDALEHWLGQQTASRYCHGDRPTLADCFLVPQVYNAERFSCDLDAYPIIRRITQRCRSLPEFASAAPENQPDAQK